MFKIISLLFIVCLLSFVQARTIGNVTSNDFPSNVQIVELYDETIDTTKDTITPTASQIIGPIAITKRGCGSGKYFKLYASSGCIASGDTIKALYQFGTGLSIGDTVSTWTQIDSIPSTGKISSGIQIDNNPANVLWIKFTNIDASVVELKKIKLAIINGCD